jgi:hypothetical protein
LVLSDQVQVIDVRESTYNKVHRLIALGTSYYFMLFGLLIAIIGACCISLLLSLLGIPIVAFGYYLKPRICKLVSIKQESIVLKTRRGVVELQKNHILSAFKFWRFDMFHRSWYQISVDRKKSGTLGSYFFMNEPEPRYNVIPVFRSWGIALRNMP